MPDLSPAAQDALNAFSDLPEGSTTQRVAAVIRSIARSAVNPDDYEPVCVFEKDYWDYGFSAAVQQINEKLLAIAEELDNA